MSRSDRFALLLSLLAVWVSYTITVRVFESMPHIEDEMAYVWQAQAIAGGRLTLPSPPEAKSFLVPFVVDYQGQRFGKYPLGWPALLAVGVFFGLRAWVNPVLAGLAIWLTYRLGKRLFGEIVGLLAAFLTLSSPFFLLNTGSLLSHPLGLVLSTAFALGWLHTWDADNPGGWLPLVTSALSLGLLAFTRPLTAVAVCLPFVLHGLYLLARRGWPDRRRLLVFILLVLAVGGLIFVWQFAVTGDLLLNPYTLWWEYDKVGFGPGVGRLERGHTLSQAWINTRFSLRVGWSDLFGWGTLSWLFLPFGLLSLLVQRQWKALLPLGVFPALVVVYLAYWIGSSLFGPRYYYEGLYSLTLASALGIAALAGWPTQPGEAWSSYARWNKARPLLATAVLALLVSANAFFYAPIRLGGMFGLYGVTRARMEPFLSQQAKEMAPALVVVHPGKWTEYGSLLELQDPFLDAPILVVISRSEQVDQALALHYPGRRLYHYYPDDPWEFYLNPRE